jgi:DNA-binding NtrC family response regulator
LTEPGAAPARALLIGVAPEDHALIGSVCDGLGCALHAAASLSEAVARLRDESFVLVLTAEECVDGDWRDLLRQREGVFAPGRLIVISESPDARLWAEVLNLGGYDVLPKPLRAPELLRVLRRAFPPERRVSRAAGAAT